MKLTLELLTLLVILIAGVIVAGSVVVEQQYKVIYFLAALGLVGVLLTLLGMASPTFYSISPSPSLSSLYSLRNFLLIYGIMFLDLQFYFLLSKSGTDLMIPLLIIAGMNVIVILKFILSVVKINISSNTKNLIGDLVLYLLSIFLLLHIWINGSLWLQDLLLRVLLTIMIIGHIIYRIINHVSTSL